MTAPAALIIQRIASAVAVLFGCATLAAGISVLLGSNPGYTVFKPLLLFNTAMGTVYVGVGLLIWRGARHGVAGAALIALLNIMVLGALALAYRAGGPIASASIQAMALRAGVWSALFALLFWSRRKFGVKEAA